VFDTICDGAWVTGVFDRVIVEQDATGCARRVSVFDFKTGRGADGGGILRRHASQLRMYRRVAAQLTGLPESEIGCDVVLTATKRRVRID
jgi:hypothetical protein